MAIAQNVTPSTQKLRHDFLKYCCKKQGLKMPSGSFDIDDNDQIPAGAASSEVAGAGGTSSDNGSSKPDESGNSNNGNNINRCVK